MDTRGAQLSEFFSMGGYAWFLWPAYAATFAVLLINIWSARKAHAEARREAKRRLEINEGEEL